MRKIICDKCKKEINTNRFVHVEFHPTNGFVVEQPSCELDICLDCYVSILDKTEEKDD